MKSRFIVHVTSTFAISIAQQVVGLFRHILIATYFGVSRGFDIYLVVYALTTLLVFNLAIVFDSVAVPRLVQINAAEGEQRFWKTSNRLLLQSVVGGVAVAALFALALRALIPVIAAGFTEPEKAYVVELSAYFLPWIAIVIPYYALTAHLRAQSQFHWVFGGEIITIIISIVVLLFWHADVEALPAAYAVGYLATALLLFERRGVRAPPKEIRPVNLLPTMANQHLANQGGVASGFVDRYFQSYLMPGGIAAMGYAGQVVYNLASLLTFREIYVVPLAEEQGRSERLERVLKGVVLVSVPVGIFLSAFAGPVVQVLFQRGQFTAAAAELTAGVIRILALSLVLSSVLAPMSRIFQIVNRVSFTHALYAVSFAGTAVFQYVFVFVLRWDVQGLALAAVLNSAVVTVVVACLVERCGVSVGWLRVLGYGGYALLASLIGAGAALAGSAALQGFLQLLVAGPIYGVVVGAAYLAIHKRIRAVAGMK